jgi:demethylmenaquinone methyltransferase/2-methoxy-6-polyprenyl-1,4-benzoquinol methylase
MPTKRGNVQEGYVRQMFQRLAVRYDLANHWMTWGQDEKWRSEVIVKAQLPQRGKLLDIGTGTGELARKACQRDRSAFVVGADFTTEMMRVGQSRNKVDEITWLNSNALDLPFASDCFDAVVSGYLLRNVIDNKRALDEQYRVLKGGGIMVCLDTTPPPDDFLHLPVRLYLRWILPIIGWLITGDLKAYRYLPESTNRFLKATELAERLHQVGFREVDFRTFMGKSMAIHWAVK